MLCFVFRNKAHAQHTLAHNTNIHGEEIIASLRAGALSIKFSKGGSNVTESTHHFLHCCVFTKNNRIGLTVTQDVKVSSEAAECGFDIVEQLLVKGFGARCLSTLRFWRLGVQG